MQCPGNNVQADVRDIARRQVAVFSSGSGRAMVRTRCATWVVAQARGPLLLLCNTSCAAQHRARLRGARLGALEAQGHHVRFVEFRTLCICCPVAAPRRGGALCASRRRRCGVSAHRSARKWIARLPRQAPTLHTLWGPQLVGCLEGPLPQQRRNVEPQCVPLLRTSQGHCWGA